MKELTNADIKNKMNNIVEKSNKDFTYKYYLLFLNSKKHLIKNINKVYKGEVILFHGSEDLLFHITIMINFLKIKIFQYLLTSLSEMLIIVCQIILV